MLLDKAGLAATILGLIFKPSKCATLTLNCKSGTKVINIDYFVQNKKIPTLKKEEPYRYLGVPVGIDVEQHEANKICEQLIIDLDKRFGPLAKSRFYLYLFTTQILVYS